MATVHCVIPAYNAQQWLGRALASLAARTRPDWNATVVDDGSTDETAAIASDWARRDPRIEVLRQPNAGVSAARNAGVERVRTPFVHFLDADDTLESEAFATMLDASDGGAVACGYTVCDERGEGLFDLGYGIERIDHTALIGDNPVWTAAQIIPTEAAQRAPFDPTLTGYEDLDVWLRLADIGVRWRVVHRSLANYTIRPGSLTKNPALMIASHGRVIDALEHRIAIGQSPSLPAPLIRRVRRSVALAFATGAAMTALSTDAAAQAVSLLDAPCVPHRIPATVAGVSARYSLVQQLGRHAKRPIHTDPALARCWAMWQEMERTGRGGRAFARRAWGNLCNAFVAHEDIAARLLDAVPEGRRVVLLGFGRNGRVLAELAAERGIMVEPRDDRPDAGIIPLDAPFQSDDWVISTPLRDHAIASRFGERIDARWADAAHALSRTPDAAVMPLNTPHTNEPKPRVPIPEPTR